MNPRPTIRWIPNWQTVTKMKAKHHRNADYTTLASTTEPLSHSTTMATEETTSKNMHQSSQKSRVERLLDLLNQFMTMSYTASTQSDLPQSTNLWMLTRGIWQDPPLLSTEETFLETAIARRSGAAASGLRRETTVNWGKQVTGAWITESNHPKAALTNPNLSRGVTRTETCNSHYHWAERKNEKFLLNELKYIGEATKLILFC